MAPRIKIKDLPQDKKISKEEMEKVVGGVTSPFGGFSADALAAAMKSAGISPYTGPITTDPATLDRMKTLQSLQQQISNVESSIKR